MSTWPEQALVLVNERATSTADLLKYKQKIVDKVHRMFGVILEQEPELLGAE
jgi:UDP-N-acetylenolpyruvoylglucosamine reductase